MQVGLILMQMVRYSEFRSTSNRSSSVKIKILKWQLSGLTNWNGTIVDYCLPSKMWYFLFSISYLYRSSSLGCSLGCCCCFNSIDNSRQVDSACFCYNHFNFRWWMCTKVIVLLTSQCPSCIWRQRISDDITNYLS